MLPYVYHENFSSLDLNIWQFKEECYDFMENHFNYYIDYPCFYNFDNLERKYY